MAAAPVRRRMEPDTTRIPDALFAEFTARLPEVCVELVLRLDGGVLLVRRTNEPARGEWFWPGSRLYKGERLDAAARRVGAEELGLAVDLEGQLGVSEHFWETSAVVGAPSRHTVNVVYAASPTADSPAVELDDQHDAWRVLDEPEAGLHAYVRGYVDRFGLLS